MVDGGVDGEERVHGGQLRHSDSQGGVLGGTPLVASQYPVTAWRAARAIPIPNAGGVPEPGEGEMVFSVSGFPADGLAAGVEVEVVRLGRFGSQGALGPGLLGGGGGHEPSPLAPAGDDAGAAGAPSSLQAAGMEQSAAEAAAEAAPQPHARAWDVPQQPAAPSLRSSAGRQGGSVQYAATGPGQELPSVNVVHFGPSMSFGQWHPEVSRVAMAVTHEMDGTAEGEEEEEEKGALASAVGAGVSATVGAEGEEGERDLGGGQALDEDAEAAVEAPAAAGGGSNKSKKKKKKNKQRKR